MSSRVGRVRFFAPDVRMSGDKKCPDWHVVSAKPKTPLFQENHSETP